jgi:hypothetical protein
LNILTKICAVVLLILVLVASVVFINMATVPQNWRMNYEREVTRAQLNEQAVRTQKLLTNRQAEEINALKSEKGTLLTQLAKREQDSVPDPLTILVKQLTEQNQALGTSLAVLQQDVKAGGDRNALISTQLQDERVKTAALQAQIGRNITEITQVQGKLDRSTQEVRSMGRQLYDRDERIKELETQVVGGASAGAAGAVAAVPHGKVTATITAVRGDTASINVGVAQGVALGQKLYIYRNASFVGYLRISEVDETQAAGNIVDKQLDPAIGDKVTNDLLK